MLYCFTSIADEGFGEGVGGGGGVGGWFGEFCWGWGWGFGLWGRFGGLAFVSLREGGWVDSTGRKGMEMKGKDGEVMRRLRTWWGAFPKEFYEGRSWACRGGAEEDTGCVHFGDVELEAEVERKVGELLRTWMELCVRRKARRPQQ